MNVAHNLIAERFVYLRDQEPLLPADWALANAALGYVQQILESRLERIRELGIDESIWVPAANWKGSRVFYRNYRALFAPENLPLLRLFCHHFTGYSLGCLGGPADARAGEPADVIDQRLAGLEATAESRIDRYFSIARCLPKYMHITPPARFGEVGWQCEGKLVNSDTVGYLERMALLYYAGFLNKASPISLMTKRQPRILEIGAGYGGLAYHIKRLLRRSRYTIVDLPESLAFASVYLGVLNQQEDNRLGVAAAIDPAPGFSFVPNFEFPALVEAGEKFDLVINTLSMSEMTERQVRAYCEGITHLIGQDGFFFEQNQDNRHLGFQFAPDIIREYFYHHVELGSPAWHHAQMPVSARPAARGSAAILEHGFAGVWANRPIPPLEKEPRAFLAPPELLEGDFGEHNLLRFGSSYYALPRSAGPVDFLAAEVADLPGVFCDVSRAAAEAFCRRKRPAAARF